MMYARTLVWMAVSFLVAASAVADDTPFEGAYCGIRSDPLSVHPHDDIGGRHITAKGVLRVLVVFASFQDDETAHPYWPSHNPPLFMNELIDPDTSTLSQSAFNLTHYFRQMSLGRFHLIGNAIWVESARSQEEYRTGAYWRANKNVLEERVDSIVDFAQFDQWTKQADYSHSNVADGQVDMIIMVWRTNMWQFYGEASLGYQPGFVLDGKRIEMGFPEYLPSPLGSGVTCQYIYSDAPRQIFQTMTHEVGHWLLGGPHPYNGESLHGKHTYWGILCNGLRTSSCANSYERERLGWITIPEMNPDVDVPLADFVTTGSARKYHPSNGDAAEYFYLENHQQLSVFDDVTANPADKGIWILHQQGPYMELDNLKIRTSDGDWLWGNPGNTSLCSTQQLPIFTRRRPQTRTGNSHRDQIPTATSLVHWMRVFENSSGAMNCGAFYSGEMFNGSFGFQSSVVFSPYSNPNSNTWERQPTSFSFEIRNETNGVITVRNNLNPLDGSPARRYLGNDPLAQGIPPATIALAWGSQWPEGQLLEPDVNRSELERQIGLSGNWTSVYQGSNVSWIDGSIPYDTNGTVPVLFRVRVQDLQGNYSVWSDTFRTATLPTSIYDLSDQERTVPDRYELRPNFPNPFNPSTTLTFTLPGGARIQITIYDLPGREIQRLVDDNFVQGIHTMVWDGKTADGIPVASGVYLCRMQVHPADGSGPVTLVRQMMVIR